MAKWIRALDNQYLNLDYLTQLQVNMLSRPGDPHDMPYVLFWSTPISGPYNTVAEAITAIEELLSIPPAP